MPNERKAEVEETTPSRESSTEGQETILPTVESVQEEFRREKISPNGDAGEAEKPAGKKRGPYKKREAAAGDNGSEPARPKPKLPKIRPEMVSLVMIAMTNSIFRRIGWRELADDEAQELVVATTALANKYGSVIGNWQEEFAFLAIVGVIACNRVLIFQALPEGPTNGVDNAAGETAH